jgi:hypothetical protein
MYKPRNDIDYTTEGSTPPHEKHDPTDKGYDDAAHTGPGRYGVTEGAGGVFGTTGGGTYAGGMHEVESPNDENGDSDENRGPAPDQSQPSR